MKFVSYQVTCGEDAYPFGCAHCIDGECECVFHALAKQRSLGAKSKVFGITEEGKPRCLASCQAGDVIETGPAAYEPRRRPSRRFEKARRRLSLIETMKGAA
jgi:hypothetical protein